MAYDEQAYLASNPDVAAAVARGDFASGSDHYNAFGQYEGRAAEGGTTGAQQNYWDSSGWAAQPGNAGGTRATGAQSTTSPNLAGNLPDNASFYSAPATFEGQNFNVGLNAQAWANVQRDIASLAISFASVGASSTLVITEVMDNAAATNTGVSALAANDEIAFSITYFV